ncbi:MAG: hypothetical protein R6X34_23390 [Chloroflexota bacterium]
MHRLSSAAAPDELWRLTLAELRLQTAVVTFDTWLAGSRVVVPACTPFFWVIVVRNEYACAWLAQRFYPVAARTATAMAAARAGSTPAAAGRQIALCFIPQARTSQISQPYPSSPLPGDGCQLEP